MMLAQHNVLWKRPKAALSFCSPGGVEAPSAQAVRAKKTQLARLGPCPSSVAGQQCQGLVCGPAPSQWSWQALLATFVLLKCEIPFASHLWLGRGRPLTDPE